MRRRVSLLIAILLMAAGCGSDRAILYKGIAAHFGKTRTRISDEQALQVGKTAPAEWQTEIRQRAREAPGQRFPNLPRSLFERRLQAAAARYGFTVRALRFYRPRQFAPSVVIETRHYLALAHAIQKIERSLDPYSERSGWAYEGFYLEAQDERRVPFVIISNAVRGTGQEGSQWARSEELYPFNHF